MTSDRMPLHKKDQQVAATVARTFVIVRNSPSQQPLKSRISVAPADREQGRPARRLVHIMTAAKSLGFLKGQACFMRSRGFDVHAISSPGEALEEFGKSEGIRTHSIEMPRKITPIKDLISLIGLWRKLRSIRPVIVHSHTPKGGLLGTLAARLAGVPICIYHIHGLPLATAAGYRRLLLRLSEKTACRLANQVLCVSFSVRNEAIREGLCPPDKIKVLLNGSINGVDSSGQFNPVRVGRTAGAEVRTKNNIPMNSPVVGFVGRIVRDKGVRELLEAWRCIQKEFQNARLLVVGEFEEEDSPGADVIEALRSDDRICLTNKITGDMAPYYAAMDVVALPTYREGFPVTAMEAASMELPVVATLVPGCVDAVRNGETGTLVPAGDAGALADAIRLYLRDADLRIRHGKAGRDRMIREFAQSAMWAAVYDEYVRWIEGTGLPNVIDAGVTAIASG